MLLLRTLSRSRSLHPLSRSLSVARSHTQAFTFIADTETQSHLSTEHATETQTHLSTQHRAARQESARASERRQACDMDGLQCSRLKVATATKVVVAGERPECDVEVLVAPSFRCDARAFPPLCRHAEPMRRSAASHGASSNVLVHVHDAGWVHVVLRHIVHQAQSAKNCMACCLMLCCKVLYHSFRGAFHDELGQDGACHGHDRRACQRRQ